MYIFRNELDLKPSNNDKFSIRWDMISSIPLSGLRTVSDFFYKKHEVLASENMIYTYEPKKSEFYDFSKINYEN